MDASGQGEGSQKPDCFGTSYMDGPISFIILFSAQKKNVTLTEITILSYQQTENISCSITTSLNP